MKLGYLLFLCALLYSCAKQDRFFSTNREWNNTTMILRDDQTFSYANMSRLNTFPYMGDGNYKILNDTLELSFTKKNYPRTDRFIEKLTNDTEDLILEVTVFDSLFKKPLFGADVSLYDENNKAFAGGSTDSTGTILIKQKISNYPVKIEVSYVGYGIEKLNIRNKGKYRSEFYLSSPPLDPNIYNETFYYKITEQNDTIILDRLDRAEKPLYLKERLY